MSEICIKKQRVVSKRLGKNMVNKHEFIYSEIEKRIGSTKICNFGHVLGSKTGVKHEGKKELPIRNFELKGCFGLQNFCKTCSKRRRRKRLEMSRQKNSLKGKSGYDIYEKEYGKNTKKCSVCKKEKCIRKHFKLSPSMECGIHNVCIICTKQYGESMGDRLIKYRPDGKHKYNKIKKGKHDDHIMPLAYGGTNDPINHQLIDSKENLSKSSTIPFDNVMNINPLLLCERWRPILYEAQREKLSIFILKSKLSFAILEEQKHLYQSSDIQLNKVFSDYNKKNNRRMNLKRCVEKFKKYCRTILKIT
jgi:hypothetical protein